MRGHAAANACATTGTVAGMRIVDARGRRVPLVPASAHFNRSDASRIDRFRAASRIPGEPPTRREVMRGILWGLVAAPMLLAAALMPAFLAFRTGLPPWAQLIAVVPMGALPALVTVVLTRRVAGHRIARTWRLAGYCPSCGHDLSGLHADHDGSTVCPECGAAWCLDARDTCVQRDARDARDSRDGC